MANSTERPDGGDPNMPETGPDLPQRDLPGAGGIEADAGEYVLGTLDPAERARFEVAAETDPEARRALAFWRDRLGPLDDVAAPVEPSSDVWDRIAATLPVAPPRAVNDNEVSKLRRSRNAWRTGAIAAAMLLAAGAFVATNADMRNQIERQIGLPGGDGPVVAELGEETYLAVVNAEGKLPAMIVKVDAKTGRVAIRTLATPQPEDRSLELWHIAAGTPAPVSLGVLDQAASIAEVEAKPGDTFAITAEDRGGSPTGSPTSPVLYSGQLVRDPD